MRLFRQAIPPESTVCKILLTNEKIVSNSASRMLVFLKRCQFIVVTSVFALALHSCVYLKSESSDNEHLHHRLEFIIGETKYSVVETRGHNYLVEKTHPQDVGASLTRTRFRDHFFYAALMTVEYDKEDTLAIGARLTTEELSTSCDATIWFFVPYSKVILNTPVDVPQKDVYFFQGNEQPSRRVSITSFSLNFKTIHIVDYPSESYFEGTFIMSGIDRKGSAFKTHNGYFNVSNINSYDPMPEIEFYEKEYSN